MKISVITRHAISNYGSVLQAYALQTVLENMGHNTEIIDYIREDEDYRNITGTLLGKNAEWSKSLTTKTLYRLILAPEYKAAGRRFETFRRQMLKLTRRYSSLAELISHKPQADLYCTGSDQVWGPIGNEAYDPAYFLAFTEDSDKRISYAGSFGKTDLESMVSLCYKEYLKRYDCISVREKSAISAVNEMGLTNAFQVLDPTLLLAREEWEKRIDRKNGDYVLVYQLHKNKQMDIYAKRFADRAGLSMVRITPFMHQITRGGKLVYLPSPGEFLAHIKNARYMITDSFHGTAFAILFGTLFIDILPGETGTRNQSLLELLGLTDRILRDDSDYSLMDRKIDFSKVHDTLSAERLKSLSTLYEMIKAVKEAS